METRSKARPTGSGGEFNSGKRGTVQGLLVLGVIVGGEVLDPLLRDLVP